jgi:acetyl-CoA synthetase
MQHYQTATAGVSHRALARLTMAAGGSSGLNACVACCDRWADGNRVALTWFGNHGGQIERSYRSLQADAARFANLLAARGVGPGDVVAGLLPRGAEMLTVVLGTWRAGAVYLPIAGDLDAAAVERRLGTAAARATKLVVTDMANRATLDLVDFCPPVLVVASSVAPRQGDGDFHAELARQSSWFAPVERGATDPFILLFSETFGQLRPVALELGSMLAALACIQIGVDPRSAVDGWDVDDAGWSFGMYFSVMQPLLVGAAAIAYESDTMTSAADRTVVALPRSQPARVAAWGGGLDHAAALPLAA